MVCWCLLIVNMLCCCQLMFLGPVYYKKSYFWTFGVRFYHLSVIHRDLIFKVVSPFYPRCLSRIQIVLRWDPMRLGTPRDSKVLQYFWDHLGWDQHDALMMLGFDPKTWFCYFKWQVVRYIKIMLQADVSIIIFNLNTYNSTNSPNDDHFGQHHHHHHLWQKKLSTSFHIPP